VDAVRQRFPGLPAHMRNVAAGALRRTDGYGSPTLARAWMDK
jgi:hypothetical protein